MDFYKPKKFFNRFKVNLGEINPYMTFIDVAVHELIDDYNQHGFSHLNVQCTKKAQKFTGELYDNNTFS